MYNYKIWFNIITILKAENITFASIIKKEKNLHIKNREH